MNNELNIIDFTNGIRSEEIQENFEILQNEINRERVNVGGYGIASGLEITPIVTNNEFAIKISSASIITKTGEEIYINEQTIPIERPHLISNNEFVTANTSNQITLKEIPYSKDRSKPVQYSDSFNSEYSDIFISYQNSTKKDDGIRIKSIDNYTLTLTGLVKRSLSIKYNYSAKRIDTVYIDINNQVQVKTSSITSTTPSAIIPENYKYLIAYILIEPDYKASKDDIPHANISIKKDLRDLRNIYTDNNGDLYICGVPFNDLQFISFNEPLNPTENQLWLNLDNNTLYVYRKVYKYNYKNSIELIDDIYNNSDIDHYDFNTDMNYNISKDILDVYVNNIKLNKNEYEKLYNDIPISIVNITDDKTSNKFRIYKSLKKNDTVTYNIKILENTMMWVPINKESYVNSKEVKIYGLDEEWPSNNYWSSIYAESLGTDENNYKNKYKYFIFDLQKDKRLLYTPNRNELSIMINQVPLHKDQYEEITLYDAYDKLPQNVLEAMEEHYNYDVYSLKTLNEEYDNYGIGFLLKEPLDALYLEGTFDSNNNMIQEEELYVEVHINRAISDAPTKRKLQRFATYIYEDSFVVNDTLEDSTVNLVDTYYRYNENQLEVYVNGLKLSKGIDFEEGTDLHGSNNEVDIDYRETHSITRQFKILKQLHINDVVNYRIVSTYCNYDHINSLLDEIELDYTSCVSKVETLYTDAYNLNNDTSVLLNNMQKELMELKEITSIGNDDKYLRKDAVLSEDNLPLSIINNTVSSLKHISTVITYDGVNDINITDYDIRQKDYVNIFHRSTINAKDTLLLRDVDCTILDITANNVYSQTRLVLMPSIIPNINLGDKIIITGIKFGKDGR